MQPQSIVDRAHSVKPDAMTNIKIRIEPPIAEETEEGTTMEEEEDLGMGDTLATGADKSYQYTFTANNPPLSKGANLLDIKP